MDHSKGYRDSSKTTCARCTIQSLALFAATGRDRRSRRRRCSMYDYRRGESILGAFLLGGIIGGVFGLLFAPRSGKENREILSSKAKEYWGEGVDFYETGKEKATEAYNTGKEKATEVYQTGKEKATETAEELRVKIDAARERLREQAETVTKETK